MSDADAINRAIVSALPSTMGASLIGSYLSAVLFGVTLLQTYQFYRKYWGRDKTYIYTLVALLTVLDALSLILQIHMMWHYLILNYDNPQSILTLYWSTVISILVTGLVGLLVQGFYAYRLFTLSEKKLYSVPIVIIILGVADLTSLTVYLVSIFKSFENFQKLTYLLGMYYGLSLGADLLITISITLILMQHRGTAVKRTDSVISKLISYTVYTGAVTTICILISLVLGQVLPMTYYDMIFTFPLSKCYVNSMLAFLNARDSLRAKEGSVITLKLTSRNQSSREHRDPDGASSNPQVGGLNFVEMGKK